MKTDAAPIFRDTKALARHLERQLKSRVVLANGCFDPLHVGHVRYLEGARECGDFLVVALNNDSSTRALKGEDRPVVGEADRARVLAGVRAVDAVLLFGEPDVSGILNALRPACHAKGTDYTVETVPEFETSTRLGIDTVIVGDPKSHASSDVVKSLRRGKGEAT
jgi:rfaE bifunctional protein nucleotidyltransferase chain/domain